MVVVLPTHPALRTIFHYSKARIREHVATEVMELGIALKTVDGANISYVKRNLVSEKDLARFIGLPGSHMGLNIGHNSFQKCDRLGSMYYTEITHDNSVPESVYAMVFDHDNIKVIQCSYCNSFHSLNL